MSSLNRVELSTYLLLKYNIIKKFNFFFFITNLSSSISQKKYYYVKKKGITGFFFLLGITSIL